MVVHRGKDGVGELETRLSMDAVMTALARQWSLVLFGRSKAFVSFVVSCSPPSVDGYSRRMATTKYTKHTKVFGSDLRGFSSLGSSLLDWRLWTLAENPVDLCVTVDGAGCRWRPEEFR